MTPQKRWQRYRSCLATGDWHVHSNYADGESTIAEFMEVKKAALAAHESQLKNNGPAWIEALEGLARCFG